MKKSVPSSSRCFSIRLIHLTLLISVCQFWGPAGMAQKMFANRAELNENRYQYMDASDIYLGFYKNGDRDAALRAANNLYKARMYQKALPLYELADSLRMIDDPEEIFGYYECLKSMKRYRDADALVRNNIKNYQERREFQLHDDKLEYYQKLESFQGVQLKNLPLNSKFSDISPTVYKDWLYFVSTRTAANNKEIHRINMQPFYNLYTVPVGSDMLKAIHPKGGFAKPETTVSYQTYAAVSLPNGINKKYHDGPILVAPSGKMIFFTTNWSHTKRPKTKMMDVNLLIYYCVKEGNTWSAPKPFPYNSFTYSNQHGFFDEKSSTLYYSSNSPGGKGGYDIWSSTMNNGGWGTPVNLSDKINTPKNEVFPSITSEGKLIFSSNGWPGLGGLDLFISEDQQSEPLNLMAGMNSEMDDFGLVFTDRESGYLVSNRSGGAGDDDIYSFKLDLKRVIDLMAVPKRVIIANVRDAKTGKNLEGVNITISNYFSGSYLTTASGSVQDTIAYDASDEGRPEIVVRYELEGYGVVEKRVPSWPQDQLTIDLSVDLEPIKAVTHVAQENKPAQGPTTVFPTIPAPSAAVTPTVKRFIIYFDFDKYYIRRDAREILTEVEQVMKLDGATQVILSGHTDTRGSNGYNEQLSNKRVNTAKKWLSDRGVDSKRIQTDYNGERKLAVICADPVLREKNIDACLTSAQHQLNRRVEIEISNGIIKN